MLYGSDSFLIHKRTSKSSLTACGAVAITWSVSSPATVSGSDQYGHSANDTTGHTVCATGGHRQSMPGRPSSYHPEALTIDSHFVEPAQVRASFIRLLVVRCSPPANYRSLASSNQQSTTNILHGSPATFLPNMPWTGWPSFYHLFLFSSKHTDGV